MSATIEKAAQYGHLELVRWLWAEEGRVPRDEAATAAAAAFGGHTEVLSWLWEQGCEEDEMTCAGAAAGGHLVLLQWLRVIGYEWDERLCLWCEDEDAFETFVWAKNEGCPLPEGW